MSRRSDFSLIEQSHEWRARIDSDEVSQADLTEFEEWLARDIRHVQAWERSQTLVAALGHLKYTDIDRDLLPKATGLCPADAKLNSRRPRWFVFPAFATALVACVAALYLAPGPRSPGFDKSAGEGSNVQYATAIGEIKTIVLSDNSTVTLGARTVLTVSFTDAARALRLSGGAAVFDVAEDSQRPFSVTSDGLTATALGTRFEVRSAGEVYRVAVAEGAVTVQFPLFVGGKETGVEESADLRAGEQVSASVEEGLSGTTSIPLASIGTWRQHRLLYEEVTIRELVADVDRYFPQDLVILDATGEIGITRVSAALDASDPEAMLETIADVFALTVDTSNPSFIQLSKRDEPVR